MRHEAHDGWGWALSNRAVDELILDALGPPAARTARRPPSRTRRRRSVPRGVPSPSTTLKTDARGCMALARPSRRGLRIRAPVRSSRPRVRPPRAGASETRSWAPAMTSSSAFRRSRSGIGRRSRERRRRQSNVMKTGGVASSAPGSISRWNWLTSFASKTQISPSRISVRGDRRAIAAATSGNRAV